MTRAIFMLLMAAGLVGCATRVPVSQPRPTDFRAEIPVDPGVIDGDGFPDASDAPEYCEEEEDPCRERHVVSLFLGYTFEAGHNGATIGLDYVYRLSESVSLGAFGEYIAGDLREVVLGGGVYFRPTEPTFVFVGAGMQIAREAEEDSKPLLRLGAGYEHELRRGWIVGPAIYMDIVEGSDPVFIAGINIGKAFR